MAYKIIKTAYQNGEISLSKHREIITAILDTTEDLAAVGTDYSPGSVAMVADKGVPSYMLNASGMWKEI